MDIEVLGRALTTLPAQDDHPYRTGPWRPQQVERSAENLEVIGEIPADLDGVYLRNTENPVHPAVEIYHPFDGDGMVHAVGFRDGKAFYRNRFIRTDGFVAEQDAGRALWAGLAEDPSRSPTRTGWGARGRMKDASSTDVVLHNGVALTSFYQCGDLYRLSPTTLETLGKATWNGKFPSDIGVSAHPKFDERTGELLFFNYGTEAPYMHYGVVDRADNLVTYIDVPLPGPRLPHDMAFTENYAILNDLPLYWAPQALAQGKYAARFHPDTPARLAVIPRHGTTADIRWFEADPTYVLHWTNAYEEGDEIVLEGFHQSDPVPPSGGGTLYQRMFRFLDNNQLGGRLHRWRLDLTTGLCKEEQLSTLPSEFGMINQRYAGRKHRYSYAATSPAGWFLFDGMVKHDSLTGGLERFEFGDGVFGSETAMAPRTGSTAEDDGYLVTITSDMNRDLSECLIFDARDITAGPVARIRLPERVSSGTHSTWAPGSLIAGWDEQDDPAATVGL
ncbi:carotenoid oxygenase family protein [Kibdelosporangium phytohabitans]|uniref:Dioxygenase n=1 Tax=Kibdelosporangium phytohabitans TaxID=860235 RepID=A0A0N9I565_9PSEU|nr:carotenoid oxygenase family protein [Kibdelosporangium phytohabitans]ALG10777.1 apocarotenoid-15,15'-oxygenase [Kibdelosporangium phytohabitans]MBE1461936.1 carotenoid cleavage dioxygenase [Kibdelosporangium phytohabitans]